MRLCPYMHIQFTFTVAGTSFVIPQSRVIDTYNMQQCFMQLHTVQPENLAEIIFGEMASKQPKINTGEFKFGVQLIRKSICTLFMEEFQLESCVHIHKSTWTLLLEKYCSVRQKVVISMIAPCPLLRRIVVVLPCGLGFTFDAMLDFSICFLKIVLGQGEGPARYLLWEYRSVLGKVPV